MLHQRSLVGAADGAEVGVEEGVIEGVVDGVLVGTLMVAICSSSPDSEREPATGTVMGT